MSTVHAPDFPAFVSAYATAQLDKYWHEDQCACVAFPNACHTYQNGWENHAPFSWDVSFTTEKVLECIEKVKGREDEAVAEFAALVFDKDGKALLTDTQAILRLYP